MLYLMSAFEYENNEFQVKEIYVSNEQTLYILQKDNGYIPHETEGNVVDIFDASKKSIYPLIGFSDIRVYDDDDPKSLAMFLHRKISEVDFQHPDADKALFNVISNFGEAYA